jgi:hypothetical protein
MLNPLIKRNFYNQLRITIRSAYYRIETPVL